MFTVFGGVIVRIKRRDKDVSMLLYCIFSSLHTPLYTDTRDNKVHFGPVSAHCVAKSILYEQNTAIP